MTLRGMKKRAVGYARYSTENQSAASVEDQQRLTAAYCERQGFELMERYADAAMSGYSNVRPGLKQMLKDAKAGAFDVLVVESLDRLSRDFSDLPLIYKKLTAWGVEIHDLKGSVEAGQVLISLVASTYNKGATTGQVRRGQEGRVLKGQFVGGRCYGYQRAQEVTPEGMPVTGKREPAPEQAAVVVRIFREFAEGRSVNDIVRDLNLEGVPGPSGKAWRKGAIYGNRRRGNGILHNEAYIGVYVWNRSEYVPKHTEVDDEMPELAEGRGRSRPRDARLKSEEEVMRVPVPEWRIVPQELWDAAQARLRRTDRKIAEQQEASGGKSRRAGIGAARKNLSVLADVLYCGECGGRMGNCSGGYRRCKHADQTSGTACTNRRCWPLEEIEARLLEALHEELMSETALRTFMDVYNAEIDKLNAAHTRARQGRERELEQVKGEIGNVLKMVRQGYGSATLMAELADLEKKQATLEAELAQPAPQPYSLHPNAAGLYRQKIENLASALRDPETGAQARESIRDLLERVVLTPAPERGRKAFDLTVEGQLAALLEAAGMKPDDATGIDQASRSSGQSVARGCSG